MKSKPILQIAVLLFICILSAGPGFTAADNTMPASPVKLIFIHHSTGGNWLADANSDQPYGELGKALMNNNYYVSATNYGWGPDSIGDSTDIPNWPDWFTGDNSSTVMAAVYSETGQNVGDFGAWTRMAADPGGENTVIMFKSCFPNSDLYGNPTDAALSEPDGQYTVANAKAVYNNLLTYFSTRTDKLFIVITAPPQNENAYSDDYQTPAQRSANARAFNNWLVNDWLDGYTKNNVAVFDYFNVLTAADNHHRWRSGAVEHVTNTSYNYSAYPLDESDSHPSTSGHTKATGEFVDLLNYWYNTWKGASSSSSGTAVNISSLAISPSGAVQAGVPVTVTATAAAASGETVYYKFYYCANYGTTSYDTTPWTVVQNYSTSNTCQYTFPSAGDYIVVVRAVTDTSSEPANLPIIGQVVNVDGVAPVNISGLAKSATSTTTQAGTPVTFTVTASAPSSETLYYKFYYCANYGTASYDTTPWTVVQNYSTSNTCQYTFPSAGDYVAVARVVTDPAAEPVNLPIVGQAVTVDAASSSTAFTLTSTAFSEGGAIPDIYTCNGSDVSPPLAISGVPAGTQSLALMLDDPDAPSGNFVHWVLYNLPASTASLSQGLSTAVTLDNGALQGYNDFGLSGYGGPCPPSGTHRYYFKLYALDITLNLAAGASRNDVDTAMTGHILGQTSLMGTYSN